jgi:site-specific DNA-adenine methylase
MVGIPPSQNIIKICDKLKFVDENYVKHSKYYYKIRSSKTELKLYENTRLLLFIIRISHLGIFEMNIF